MKIISKFKDYYDHVGHIYGNDPIVTYTRCEISSNKSPDGTLFNVQIPKSFCKSFGHYYTTDYYDLLASSIKNDPNTYGFDWLVVGLKAFMVIVTYKKGGTLLPLSKEVLSLDKHAHLIDVRTKRSGARYYWGVTEMSTEYINENHGVVDNNILPFTKLVGHPVYLVSGSNRRNDMPIVDARCPKLGELGLASMYPAEQLYQDLEYFLLNTMNPSPDNAPPVQVEDKDRIVQHGFDLKKSFRHRTQ